MEVIATDTSGLSGTATAVITVRRNLNTPRWLQTTYETTIDENYPLQSQILTLLATDDDFQSPFNTLSFSIVSSINNAASIFQISNTGVLSLTSTLVGTVLDSYQVNVCSVSSAL